MSDVNQSAEKMKSFTQTPNKSRKEQHTPSRANQASGAILLLILFGIFWIYGFQSEFRYAKTSKYPTTGLSVTNQTTGASETNQTTGPSKTQQTQSILGSLVILSIVFTVIGYGLLMSFYNKSTFTALLLSLFTVSNTIIISPILAKLWYNIFIGDFTGTEPKPTDPSRMYQYSYGGVPVQIDYYNLKVVLANCISQLVAALALHGRLNHAQIFINSIGFNVFWNLNHFLCAFLAKDSPENRVFDDYQISNVYLFAAVYGLVSSCIIKSPSPATTTEPNHSKVSEVIGLLGTFFLFLSFCATSTMYPLKFTVGTQQFARTYFWQEALISIFIAMSASIIFFYAFSILFNSSSRFGVQGSLIGTISGAIMYGPVSGTCINIGAAIAVGLFAGFMSALFYEKIYPSLNGNFNRDRFGLFNILLISFLGTFFIAPIVLIAYANNSLNLPTLYPSNTLTTSYTLSNSSVAGWALSYVGVSIAIGLIGAIAIGLLMRFLQKKSKRFFDDTELFKSSSYGLRENYVVAPINFDPAPSAQFLGGR